MVGGAVEPHAAGHGMGQPMAKLGAVGHEEGGVEQAGRIARRRPHVGAGRQREKRAVAGP
ncbi:hypothetical protein D3C72_2431540 [compost metagenome]